jgi:hypothetical protein
MNEELLKISKEIFEFSKYEGINISNKNILNELKIVSKNILTIGKKDTPYFEEYVLDNENIEDIAHDVAVERSCENKNYFGISIYQKNDGFGYWFSASNDDFQITKNGLI